MYILFITVALLPSISAVVDCKFACRTCKQNQGHPEMLEIYCAMCNECKLRRREKMAAASTSPTAPSRAPNLHGQPKNLKRTAVSGVPIVRHEVEFVQHEEEEECPTPPPCSSEEEVVNKVDYNTRPTTKRMMTTTTTTTTTTTSTTTTTEKPKCPPIEGHCRKKKSHPLMMPCVSCVPICMTPCPTQRLMETTATTKHLETTTLDYVYVYVGVPKNLMNND